MQTRSNLLASAGGWARIAGVLAAGALALACSRSTGTSTSDNGPSNLHNESATAGAAKRDPGESPAGKDTRGDMDTWQIVKDSAAPEAGVATYEKVTVPGFDLFWVSEGRPNASRAVAVSTSDGTLLDGKDAVRAIVRGGYRDAMGLAHIALIFLERGGEIASEPAPALDGNRLIYHYRNNAMETMRSEVDLDTLTVTSTPAP